MTTTILVFNSSHEDASATPPRAQAFFRTKKEIPFGVERPHRDARNPTRARSTRDARVATFKSTNPVRVFRVPPRALAFFCARLRVSPIFAYKSARVGFPSDTKSPRRDLCLPTVLRARRHRKRRSTLATVFSKSVGLAPASFTIFTRDIFLFAVWCVRANK